ATETDPEIQKEYYYKIQELVAQDIPYINLFNMKQVISALNSVDGLKIANDGGHDLRYMYKLAE
ncbi:MAG: hypothetical protein IKF16_01040, partial [Lachnospiraceae bacterium]|nr:hypothetical protein [Lachnospiraceae bacterium]